MFIQSDLIRDYVFPIAIVEKNKDNSFKFSGYLPVLKITASQYLDAYGVNKKETERNKTEYNSNERKMYFVFHPSNHRVIELAIFRNILLLLITIRLKIILDEKLFQMTRLPDLSIKDIRKKITKI